ncbi:MAG: glycosyltransferase family 2 protein [Rubricella sp.]
MVSRSDYQRPGLSEAATPFIPETRTHDARDETLAGLIPLEVALSTKAIAWRAIGPMTWIARADPSAEDAIRAALPPGIGPVFFIDMDRSRIEAELRAAHGAALARRAETLCPEEASCRGFEASVARRAGLGALGLLALLIVFAPSLFLTLLIGWIVVMTAANTAIRLAALLGRRETIPDIQPKAALLPVVSILVPVYREGPVLAALMAALGRLDYPHDKLDVKLLLEEDDDETPRALATLGLPGFVEVITVPDGRLRTKPRAMNYALPFCRGEIVGIYDAEDKPEPDQIRKAVGVLAASPADVACVQAALDFHNPRDNWLTRCFTIEYAIWFRVLLHGVRRLGLPIPLGGTSLFIRRRVLEEIGAWDAHNVTEDADLGMRLERHGYRTGLVPSTTWEEANGSLPSWLRQRSRWLKGYAMTWVTQMRDPAALWRELGPRRFLGLQVLLLGSVTAYLAMPLWWVLVGVSVTGASSGILSGVPGPLAAAFWALLPLAQIVMLAAALRALMGTGRRGLIPWVFTLPAYWSLGAISAWRAVFEIFSAPFHWHKTAHGRNAAARSADHAPKSVSASAP